MFEKQAKLVENTRPDQNHDDFIEVQGLIVLALASALVFGLFLAFIAWMLV